MAKLGFYIVKQIKFYNVVAVVVVCPKCSGNNVFNIQLPNVKFGIQCIKCNHEFYVSVFGIISIRYLEKGE